MILVDNNEPEDIIKLLRQTTAVVVSPLNQMHISDYFFGNYEGKRFQFSRKQAGELLGNIDEAEDQLRDYYQQADENFQIVEGIISPVRLFGHKWNIPVSNHGVAEVSTRDIGVRMYSYQVEPNGYIERGHSFTAVHTPAIIYAWVHRLAMAGISTYFTLNWQETARLLMTIYHNEQKPAEEHSTLQRVIRPRIQVREAEPFVKALLFLSNAYKLGIGEDRATAIADRFCNILDLATADISEVTAVDGIGQKTAEKLLTALGRSING
jgi:hypothetical protein